MHPIRRRVLTLGLAAALSCAAALPALGADEVNTTSGLTAAGAPLALHGFDPVAYFEAGEPTRGDAKLASVHEGATYYFTSAANQKAFDASPAKYAPAFGGFCAFGVSVGKKFDGNPYYWKISGGRLYLNLNAEIARKFDADVAGSLAKAEAQWRRIRHAEVSEL